MSTVKNIIYLEDNITPTFGLTDLKAVSAGFENVCFLSENPVTIKDQIPAGITIIESYLPWNLFKPVKILASNLYFIGSVWMRMFLTGDLSVRTALQGLKSLVSNFYKAQQIDKVLRKFQFKPEETVCYAFWFYDNIYLALLKKKYPGLRVVTRAHAGDLYEDGPTLKNALLMRKYQMQKIDYILPVSAHGTKYLKMRYPGAAAKILCIRLGTPDHPGLNPGIPENVVIVSCAHVVNRKRIDLIAKTLCKINTPVTWFHIGNENKEDADKDPAVKDYLRFTDQLRNNKLVDFHPMGLLSSAEIYAFYQHTPVSFLLSVSENEGIPVSMMEAMSFGIPVISTNVGGCAEIVTNETGKLLSADVTEAELKQEIEQFSQSEMNSDDFRRKIRKYWEENYSVSANYSKLLQVLKN